ncbi:hypothetical protein [Shewanella waksmanii]|uniref:hypothetical protein n=1 Tax=Shewanella waksmanii TaxID=213783 RepID=UPI003736A839
MKNSSTLTSLSLAITFALSSHAIAEEVELQDMSDPLAVYTQAGLGYTDKGLNLKVGQTYDTGSDTTIGMNRLEVKGFAGDAIGWNNREGTDSIDSLRFRNFNVDLTNGRGSEIDVNLSFTPNQGTQGSASYNFIQALPKMGPVSLYPLAGLGVAFGESFDSDNSGAAQAQDRWDLHGTFYVAGLYGKVELSDKVWLNYNPMYMGTMSGSDIFKQHGLQGEDSVLLHEAALSYQLNPRTTIRYYANWNENVSFENGDHRIEVNYQF